MKKTFLRAALCLSLAVSFTSVAVSCSNNDDTEEVSSTLDPNDFKGDIQSGQTVTLDATKTYKLTGKLWVKEGATLIIPAGTKIVASEGANYLIVDRGAKIFINGTAAAPVVFEGAVNKPGSWGGIVVLGKAPSNRSAAGTSTSELGELTYGGTTKDDNSGSIQYVKIKNSGFKYNPSKEFNGLSLFGVGSGTKVSYVYIYDGADDGVEFFGGNVNADHIVVLGVGDDSIDWTEGWQGTAEYIYAARKKEYANDAEPGNRGVEADTQDPDHDTTFGNGVSNPTIKNATFLGNTKGTESQAMKIRAGSQGKFDNIVLANFSTGIDFETNRTLTWFQGGSYVKNVRFESIGTNIKAKNTAGTAVDLTAAVLVNTAANGAGNGSSLPTWAQGWTGVSTFTATDAGN
ncbi:hypothetical protein [Chryseobacterium balustinum]|uniref:T9SS C-terminal target domain-containing protein n=1 Tax=Chryseobacterium balustinum TaxID=246 RepID=A0AAX2IJQ0_9FLAO|nr:hypothetical protein [Chryseobacterium balustinum]AZB30508.1 hypothetical protein EB354_15275 [Chryseobacterium balustinum]SKB48817.1 hypothetical protein SAMN05421800_102192 [Chryseobacterium balustinum]SQA89081.1 Uncharacterised protein [Chryseobacterium balustinum]